MTVDEANTKLATASTRQQRIAAYNELALGAAAMADALAAQDESQGTRLITRANRLKDQLAKLGLDIRDYYEGECRASDEIDSAIVQLTVAIEAINYNL
jgi:hypothetical protein